MTNEIVNKMVEEINIWINAGVKEFNKNGSSEWYNRVYTRIGGMIAMLSIATGKDYYFDEDGVHEKVSA